MALMVAGRAQDPEVHRQQTSVINAIRAHMAEFGIVARVGRDGCGERERASAHLR
jgi:hypothetical protein